MLLADTTTALCEVEIVESTALLLHMTVVYPIQTMASMVAPENNG